MIRTFKQSDVEDLAKYGTIPIINGLTDYQKMTLAIEYAQMLFKVNSGTFTAYDTTPKFSLRNSNLTAIVDRFGIVENGSYWETYTWENGTNNLVTDSHNTLAPTMHMKIVYVK